MALQEYKNLIKRYDFYWFQSPSQAKKLRDLMNFDSTKTIVLTPGIDEKLIESLKKIDEFKNYYNIIIVGSIQKRKGQYFIPEILEYIKDYIPNVKFHVVGLIVDRDYMLKIKRDEIDFYGFKKDYLNFIYNADIVLQLSEEEGISRVLREAMAIGKSIIAFELDGTKDLLVNREDAMLAPFGDSKKISEYILELYKNKSLAKELAKNAKKNYFDKYSTEIYLKNLQNILKKLHESILH